MKGYVKNADFEHFEVSSSLPDNLKFLVTTSNYGLLLFGKNLAKQLFYGESMCGITKSPSGKWWAYYVAQNQDRTNKNRNGYIGAFDLTNDSILNFNPVCSGLGESVHQIDFIDGDLAVVHTSTDSLYIYKNIETALQKYLDIPIDPTFKRKPGAMDPHFNSVYAYKDIIYVLAHNQTYKCKKLSQIYELDKNYKFIRKYDVPGGGNCHNIYIDDNIKIVCNSLNNSVWTSSGEVLKTDKFTRGLAVGKDNYVVGGSTVEFNAYERNKKDGSVFITDKNFNLLSTLTIKRTQVYDIRIVDMPDYGMSNIT